MIAAVSSPFITVAILASTLTASTGLTLGQKLPAWVRLLPLIGRGHRPAAYSGCEHTELRSHASQAYRLENEHATVPFISDTGVNGAAHYVFAVGLSAGCLIGLFSTRLAFVATHSQLVNALRINGCVSTNSPGAWLV